MDTQKIAPSVEPSQAHSPEPHELAVCSGPLWGPRCNELRSFFASNLRRVADSTERGRRINPREVSLLVQTAREIISLEAAS